MRLFGELKHEDNVFHDIKMIDVVKWLVFSSLNVQMRIPDERSSLGNENLKIRMKE